MFAASKHFTCRVSFLPHHPCVAFEAGGRRNSKLVSSATTRREGEGEGEDQRVTVGRREVVSGLIGFIGCSSPSFLFPSHAKAKEAAPVPVQALLESLESAVAELRDMKQAVQLRDKLGIELQSETYSELRKKLRSGALGDVRKVAESADAYIGEAPLDVLDETVWASMPNDQDSEGGMKRTVKVPFGPNEFLCVIFSCVNDPRMVPSTDLLLTQKNLDTGLRMGMARDRRISNQGILTNMDDLESKLIGYKETLRARTSFSKLARSRGPDVPDS